jgi:hypothetical protein
MVGPSRSSVGNEFRIENASGATSLIDRCANLYHDDDDDGHDDVRDDDDDDGLVLLGGVRVGEEALRGRGD